MNRNTPSNHFDLAPQVSVGRSKFDRNHSLKTSFNVGQLVPIYLEEVLPGDTFDVKTSKVARLQTLKTPVYDNLYMDTYFFFVPNRLVWEHWKNLMGENTESAWIPQTEYSVPQVTAPENGWSVGTIADYFGIPTGVADLSINALPFRAYCRIVQDWFIDQNLQDPVNIPVNDSDTLGSNGDNYITDMCAGGQPFVAAKFHDYFTSCLPAPQKGPDVQIPLSSAISNTLPVYTIGEPNAYYANEAEAAYGTKLGFSYPAYYDAPNHYSLDGTPANTPLPGFFQALTAYTDDPKGIRVNVGTDQRPFLPATHGSDGKTLMGLEQRQLLESYELQGLTPVNLVAGGTGELYMATINSLRTAFQIQRLYEKDARGGTRYIEVLRSHFGVTSPDARLQRSEYLGGKRCPLNISQVTQLGATTQTSPLGDVAGMSVTTDVNKDFSKSFVEHGFIIGLAVVRYDHTYQQGLNRLWSRKSRLDYYWPVLAHLGEQPVYVKEIYATGDPTNDELVFGYQEAYADYRYKPSFVTSEMRSTYATSLDIWHFGDDYDQRPSLSSSWIMEDKSNVDRTLAVTSAVSNQVFCDFFFENKATRCMPLYGIPGLIDHN